MRKARGAFRRAERGRVDFGDFCGCKRGINRPEAFLSNS